jgi:hypothetical protein
MSNRIRHVEVRDSSLSPAQAEAHLFVTPQRRTPTTEVRGRLMGPSCPYSSTIEVAYPLRPLPDADAEALACRVLIPEPSLWEPESPFLYRGPVELWQDGARADRTTVSHGLRSLSLGPRGLRVNGRPLTLRGRAAERLTDDEALGQRRAGCNLLVAPAEDATAPLWDTADRLGFFVLGRLTDGDDEALRRLAELERHPCCLGWLVPSGDLRARLPAGSRVGVEWDGGVALPPGVSFVVGGGEAVAAGLPLLVRDGEEMYAQVSKRADAPPLLGWVG